jgi:hypothetical protein
MKHLKISNVKTEEIKSLQILKKHYGLKTYAGAARKAINEMAELKTEVSILREKQTKNEDNEQ